MATGTVKWFNESKASVLFLQMMEVRMCLCISLRLLVKVFRTLAEGQQLNFDVEDGPKGPQATNVTV